MLFCSICCKNCSGDDIESRRPASGETDGRTGPSAGGASVVASEVDFVDGSSPFPVELVLQRC